MMYSNKRSHEKASMFHFSTNMNKYQFLVCICALDSILLKNQIRLISFTIILSTKNKKKNEN